MARFLWGSPALQSVLALALLSAPPVSAGRACNVITDCGAIPDNHTLATDAINACIRSCCDSPGCSLVFPPSSAFLITSLDISNTTGLSLEFGANASLSASTNASLYPIAPFYPRMGNTTCYRSVVFGRFVTDLAIVGPSSAVVDGNGWSWQPNRSSLPHQAPKLLELVDVTGLRMSGVTWANSANWHLHLLYCRDAVLTGLTVLGARAFGGTDGIDPSSCSDVLIDSAYIDVGDDGMAVTSGLHDLTGLPVPTNNVTVRNSYIRSRNFAIGSSTSANVSNVTVEDCTIGDEGGSAPWAIKVKTHGPRGGVVSDLVFQRLRLGRIAPNAYQQPKGGYALAFLNNYGSPSYNPAFAPARIERVLFKDIAGISAVWAANPLVGWEAGAISGLRFDNVSFGAVSAPEPWVCANATGTTIGPGGLHPAPKPGTCGLPGAGAA
jgi:polygalacturonase